MTELEKAREKAWSIENMAAHGAEGRTVTHIEDIEEGKYIYQYFRDSEGDYWFKVKIRLENGQVIDRCDLFPGLKKNYTGATRRKR